MLHSEPLRLTVTVALCLALRTTAAAGADEQDAYVSRVKPLLKAKCYACHGAIKQEGNLRLDTGAFVRKGGDSGPAIDTRDAANSVILERITAQDAAERMPPEGASLTEEQVAVIRRWISQGGQSPAGETPQQDPRKHWAYQPLAPIPVPQGAGHPIDRFVRRRLNRAGITPVGPARPEVLVRRLFLDLHGLPPTPDQLKHWAVRLRGTQAVWKGGPVDQETWRELIDWLLDSPHYGERWAQHWLDVVRYADTHGFEVNTPRPNAWPYRDYVIAAFNSDKPYDRFVFEQLAGDSIGEDAATGFLVAAAVLLPGQIGADEASKRLARQDSLDEIIVGTSATFLGMTVGCARCHDHKFDPITQRDYYALQAFFAGVEYGDRPLRDGEHKKRAAVAAELGSRISKLSAKLRTFEPVAFAGRTIIVDDEDSSRVTLLKKKNGAGANPAGKMRGYADDPGDGSRVGNISRRRYTWWDNGAGEDTFTWNPAVAGRFRLWISWGAHGSGVHTRDARYVLDRDGNLKTRDDQVEIAKVDQYYFSGVTEGESEKKPLWSGLLDVGAHEWTEETRLVLRGGQIGAGITADVIVLQEEPAGSNPAPGAKQQVRGAEWLTLRDPVAFTRNTEKFRPVPARFVRFTTFETTNDNRYEPCLDELEVFRADSEINVALASRGAKPSSSGNYSETGIHQLKHINDGKYGNSHSWISNRKGAGWVQIELADVESIDRVQWGRDRDGKFKDRLAVRYRVDVSTDGRQWQTVARSDDRAPRGTPVDRLQSLVRAAAGSGDLDLAGLVAELTKLRGKKSQLEKPRMVYAGKFREPDTTRVLHRGDPEQPLDEIAPQVPAILGQVALSEQGEPPRRVRLAKWISDRRNPMTARVMVNRVWQNHFGRGIVDTPSDFGLNGAPPSHPELLDWLANEWITQGWSMKTLHRLILTSAAYQQSSRIEPRAQSLDADCKLIWRFPSRRLEAEAIRDSMLYVSGQLNLDRGGPGFDFFKSRGGLSGFPPIDSFDRSKKRRMIYAHKIRMERVPVFGAFDCPDAGQPSPRRSRSTTPIQALNLFNSRFVVEQAGKFADRAKAAAPGSVERQIEFVFENALGRQPSVEEKDIASPVIKEHGLEVLCRVLLNSNEFLFIP